MLLILGLKKIVYAKGLAQQLSKWYINYNKENRQNLQKEVFLENSQFKDRGKKYERWAWNILQGQKEVLKNKQMKPRKTPHNYGGLCQRNTRDKLKKLPMAKLWSPTWTAK